jgi:hypothetical protein
MPAIQPDKCGQVAACRTAAERFTQDIMIYAASFPNGDPQYTAAIEYIDNPKPYDAFIQQHSTISQQDYENLLLVSQGTPPAVAFGAGGPPPPQPTPTPTPTPTPQGQVAGGRYDPPEQAKDIPSKRAQIATFGIHYAYNIGDLEFSESLPGQAPQPHGIGSLNLWGAWTPLNTERMDIGPMIGYSVSDLGDIKRDNGMTEAVGVYHTFKLGADAEITIHEEPEWAFILGVNPFYAYMWGDKIMAGVQGTTYVDEDGNEKSIGFGSHAFGAAVRGTVMFHKNIGVYGLIEFLCTINGESDASGPFLEQTPNYLHKQVPVNLGIGITGKF